MLLLDFTLLVDSSALELYAADWQGIDLFRSGWARDTQDFIEQLGRLEKSTLSADCFATSLHTYFTYVLCPPILHLRNHNLQVRHIGLILGRWYLFYRVDRLS